MINNSVSGLEICPKCRKGHLYPVVTDSASTKPKGIRDYQCAICGHKQIGTRQTQYVNVKNKKIPRLTKAKKIKGRKRK